MYCNNELNGAVVDLHLTPSAIVQRSVVVLESGSVNDICEKAQQCLPCTLFPDDGNTEGIRNVGFLL
jgi:hypothetical protein